MGKYVIYFKGGLKSIDAIAPSGSNSNYTFAGPCCWDSPVTYHLTITKSGNFLHNFILYCLFLRIFVSTLRRLEDTAFVFTLFQTFL